MSEKQIEAILKALKALTDRIGKLESAVKRINKTDEEQSDAIDTGQHRVDEMAALLTQHAKELTAARRRARAVAALIATPLGAIALEIARLILENM